jgi:hypothetical protein
MEVVKLFHIQNAPFVARLKLCHETHRRVNCYTCENNICDVSLVSPPLVAIDSLVNYGVQESPLLVGNESTLSVTIFIRFCEQAILDCLADLGQRIPFRRGKAG